MTTNAAELTGHEINRLVKRLESVREAAREFVAAAEAADLALTRRQHRAFEQLCRAIAEADRS